MKKVLFLVLLLINQMAHAGTVTVVTSFPREITNAYRSAFEKKNPGIKLEILNKNTVAAIAYVRETAVGSRPDVFWASAPDAFEVLKRERLLEKLTDLFAPITPEKVGSFPVSDPEGFYRGQALAGYGLMYNTRYLAAKNIKPPREWRDLTLPAYFGHVAISSPSRSGTTHLTVEAILQNEGWTRGWELMLQLCGNSAQITERSFGVPDGVNSGQFGIGVVIDYLGLAAKYSGFPVDFNYPSNTPIVPANIAIISGGKNTSEARKFVEFSLSKEGQELLLDPKISRIPVLEFKFFPDKIPPGYPDIYKLAAQSKSTFNADLSELRYNLVSSMFDQTITFRHKELVAATRVIQQVRQEIAKRPGGGQKVTEAQALLQQATALAFSPVIGESMAKDKGFLELFTKNKKDISVGKDITALEERWTTKARENYAKAQDLATRALSLLK